MKLSFEYLHQLCSLAKQAAQRAGLLLQERVGENHKVLHKKSGTSKASQIVTEIDALSQDLILEELASSIKEFNLGLLTEESVDDSSRFTKDYFWSIDPLDGTLPYSERKSGYAVSIALVSKTGVPVIGVVYDPVSQNLYQAIKGKGVLKNDLPFKQQINSAKNFSLVIDRSFLEHVDYKNRIKKIKMNIAEFRNSSYELKVEQPGGAVINALYVLENAPSCYLKLPKQYQGGGSIWDFAATACIFNETQALASNVKGELLDLNRIDSSFMNHQGILFASDFGVSKFIRGVVFEIG